MGEHTAQALALLRELQAAFGDAVSTQVLAAIQKLESLGAGRGSGARKRRRSPGWAAASRDVSWVPPLQLSAGAPAT